VGALIGRWPSKLLPADFANDADRVRRFEQEARAPQRSIIPNILTVYDIGEHQAHPNIVAELLSGEELRDRLGHGRFHFARR
jgi:serine/threonine-protein kinase